MLFKVFFISSVVANHPDRECLYPEDVSYCKISLEEASAVRTN